MVKNLPERSKWCDRRVILVAAAFLAGVDGARAEGFVLDADVGGGVISRPSWEGARSHEAGFFPIFRLHTLTVPGLISIGGGNGLSISPSLRFLDERKQSSDTLLRGLGDVDAAYEVGGKLSYRMPSWRVFVALRRGFGGHEGWVGGAGADVIWQPREDFTIEAGPRLSLASQDTMKAYFGITTSQAVASGYQVHEADGGLKGAGFEALARWRLTPVIALEGRLGYERLMGDAGGSPLVKAGRADQVWAGVGLSYRLNLADRQR